MMRETNARRAMLKAAINAVNKPGTNRSLIERVSVNADEGIGMVKEKDWNAHLSLRTFQHLQRQGVMA